MNLTITLSQIEYNNILGWVNKGLADPVFAACPYRIVLEERTQARFDQIKNQFYPPDQTDDPETTFTARAKVGQNCAWGNLITPAEQNWAVGKWGADASRRVNFYAVGGANVQERDNGDGTYSFVKFADGIGTFYPDVNGAGDAWVAKVVAPTPLPGPLP